MKSYAVEAQVLAKRGDIQKAHVMMTKKKLVEKEVSLDMFFTVNYICFCTSNRTTHLVGLCILHLPLENTLFLSCTTS